jgi:hypothetical protein
MMLLKWIAHTYSSAGRKMSTKRVVSCWLPTPSQVNLLEAEASLVQNLCNLAFRPARVEFTSLNQVENKLFKYFTTFEPVRPCHEQIYRALACSVLYPSAHLRPLWMPSLDSWNVLWARHCPGTENASSSQIWKYLYKLAATKKI